jgi:DNA-binding transcriptional ArsR family regulator
VPAGSISCIKILKALADETRWSLVQELLERPSTVNELTERLHATDYNVSKHLRILREAGIVQQKREGKHVRCFIREELASKLARERSELDMGCCTFRFDRSQAK